MRDLIRFLYSVNMEMAYYVLIRHKTHLTLRVLVLPRCIVHKLRIRNVDALYNRLRVLAHT